MIAVRDLPIRRVLFVSTHGVERTDQLPFSLQNVWGQLDKQRATEQEVILQARTTVPAFSVLRVPKLKDDASVQSSDYSGALSVRAELQPGDALGGEVPISTAAALLASTLRRTESVNSTFSLGALSASGGALAAVSDAAYWDDQFLKLVGPEVYRRPLDALGVDETASWLREWARRFLRPGQQLTTPVAVEDVRGGVLLRFLTRATGYADFDATETKEEKWASAKPGVAESKAGKPDGALLLIAETEPSARVRVVRAEMDEGVVVKEMSEEAVLRRLDKDLAELGKRRR